MLLSLSSSDFNGKTASSVAAVQSCFCFIIVAAVIVLGIGALFLLFVLLYSQRVSSQSCETLGELLHTSPLANSAAAPLARSRIPPATQAMLNEMH